MPSKDSVRVSPVCHGLAQTVSPVCHGQKPSSEWARIPWEVGTDDQLKDRDVRVYFALASFTRKRTGPRASAGIRWIAECVHVAPRLVVDSLRRLSACGHLEMLSYKNGQRREYRLTSPVFAGVPARTSAPIIGSPKSIDRAQIRCPHCRKLCRGLLKVGWCRSCNWNGKVRRIVREEIGKSA